MDMRNTVLLVNDDETSRAALKPVFEQEYRLLEAENGEQALLLMEENCSCIAAVLLDPVMPVKDGYEVLVEMGRKESLSEIPVIIITDECAPEVESKAFDLGASEVIVAPYDLSIVQRRVRNIIDLNRKRWRLEEVLEEQSEALRLTGEAAAENDVYNLLAGVYRCKNDFWLTLEGNCGPISALLGYTEQELQIQFQNRLMNLVVPEDRQMIRQQMAKQLAQGRTVELEHRLLCKNGQVLWVLNKGQLSAAESGAECLQCILLDVTQTKQTLESLRLSLERHQIIMAQTDDIIFEWDMVSDTVAYSNKWKALFGYEPLSEHFSSQMETSSHFHPEDIEACVERMQTLKKGADYQETEVRIAKADGQYLWCRLRATAQYDAYGKPVKAVGVVINIDAEKRAAQELQNQAEKDPLTNLLNKNTSRLQVEARLQSRRPEECSALLIIDLDNFKQINDQHGHLFGDTVLTYAAAEIRRFFRSEDVIGRIGGDEFMVFMSNIPGPELAERRCADFVDSFHIRFRDRLVGCGLSCSVGAAISPAHGTAYQELFEKADMALYRAKAEGKNRWAFYEETDCFPAEEVCQIKA